MTAPPSATGFLSSEEDKYSAGHEQASSATTAWDGGGGAAPGPRRRHGGATAPADPAAAAAAAAPQPGAETGVAAILSSSGWIGLAAASGLFAALNGMFAKLTTTELTVSLAQGMARRIGLEGGQKWLELGIRCIFFILNVNFNAGMWYLLTIALARGRSATQVSIVNTATNFMATALIGLFVFFEKLPPMWWVGAAMLTAGSVMVGRSEGGAGAGTDDDDDHKAEPARLKGEGGGH